MNGCWKWNKQNAVAVAGGQSAEPNWIGAWLNCLGPGYLAFAQDHPRQPSATAPDFEPTTSLVASTYVQLISSAEGHGRLVL